MIIFNFLIIVFLVYLTFRIVNKYRILKIPANRDERTTFIISKSLSEVALVIFCVDFFQGLLNIIYSIVYPGIEVPYLINIGYGENNVISIYPIVFDIIVFFIFWRINKKKYGNI